MQNRLLAVHCVFAPDGPALSALVEQSFRLYLRRVLDAETQEEPRGAQGQEGAHVLGD